MHVRDDSALPSELRMFLAGFSRGFKPGLGFRVNQGSGVGCEVYLLLFQA